MSFITTMTRMWLTGTTKPFLFRKDDDFFLDYEAAQNLGLYIHIPFCRNVCSFCPYCKVAYEKSICDAYVDDLLKEIHLVGRSGKGKKEVTSLYFGGGTPCLALDRLDEIIGAVKEHFVITQGIGLELHPEDVTEQTVTALRRIGVTKISIGIQSFHQKLLKQLGREVPDADHLFHVLQTANFETVSMDFIFALPNQTFADLQSDIELAFSHGANHIAIYPFIDFSFTNSTIPAMKKTEKRKLLDAITLYCQDKGYRRDSIWTFSNVEDATYSSMTRDNFLGFGCSATTLLKDQFKINTFSIDGYRKRIAEQCLPTALTIRFRKKQRMVYYLFWTAYTTKVREADFQQFFGKSLSQQYGLELWLAEKLGFLTYEDGLYEMTTKGAFYYHYYEQYYTLAYIDQMWGVMRTEAFPEELHF